ncbi:TPA: phage tail protein [Neisseria cinerea]
MHPIETPDKTFHDGDGVSELGTILPAWWLNQVQSELLAVLTAAGIQPDKSQPNQLLAALNKLAVVTTGNQEIAGDKTFTGLTTLKKGAIVADSVGDFNANQYLQIGSNNVNSYLHNKKSGKYLSMRNDGELRYDGKRLLNVDDLAGMIPSGAVMYFAGQTAPTGWLKANGAAVSRTNYAALFAAIGTTYGTGDGRTTFNLPDLRGEFVRGWDDGRGIDSGRALGSTQGDAIRNITGKIDSGKNGALQLFDYIEPTGAFGVEKSWKQWTSEGNGGNDNIPRAITFDASRVVPTANENRPRNIALLACIKI